MCWAAHTWPPFAESLRLLLYAPKALESQPSGLVPKLIATAGLSGARKRRGGIGNGMKFAAR